MKNNQYFRMFIAGLLVSFFLTGLMTSCQKKDDPKLTSAGGGASPQSVVTVKGAGQ